MDKISIVVSCYNEEDALPLFCEETQKMIKTFDDASFEFIFVNDGSRDNTLNILKDFHKRDPSVRFLSFSRNFGKEAAMVAGMEASTGDYVAVMDADLQDPPSMLLEMYAILKNQDYDYDCVATRRVTRRGEPVVRSFFARLFYRVINRMSDTEMVDGARDFRLMSRKMVNAILSMKEYNRYSKGLNSFVGFETCWLEYENVERAAGKTKWSFWKLCKYALNGIVAFSTTPLVLSSVMGILFCFIAFILICAIIARTLIWGDPTSGWPSLACIIFLVSGVQLFCVGILGQYLAKTYSEVKHRPLYFIKETEKDYDLKKGSVKDN